MGLAWYVRGITSLANLAIDRLTRVTFVETEMLRLVSRGLGTFDRNGIQGLGHQLLVRHIGACDSDS